MSHRYGLAAVSANQEPIHITFLFGTAPINDQLLLNKLRSSVLTDCNPKILLLFQYPIGDVTSCSEMSCGDMYTGISADV